MAEACELSGKELDSIVYRLHDTISNQIDCLQCANCCKKVSPLLKPEDRERLASHLELSIEEFTAQYLREDDEGEGRVFKSSPCPFLDSNRCTVYPQRPDDCRSFPNLHKREFRSRLIQVVYNCSVCPIVYNVYESLKQELKRR